MAAAVAGAGAKSYEEQTFNRLTEDEKKDVIKRVLADINSPYRLNRDHHTDYAWKTFGHRHDYNWLLEIAKESLEEVMSESDMTKLITILNKHTIAVFNARQGVVGGYRRKRKTRKNNRRRSHRKRR